MYNKIDNGQISVATSADNFNEIIVNVGRISPELMKYSLQKYGFMELGDGLTLTTVKDDDSILRVTLPNGNWYNVVKNHSVGPNCNWKYVKEQVQGIICTHYNVPNPKNFPTFNDWAEDLLEYGFCGSEKRMAKVRADYEAETAKFNNLIQKEI